MRTAAHAALAAVLLLCSPHFVPERTSAAELPRDWNWVSPHLKEHPLAGQIWNAGARQAVPLATLRERVARADLALVGEVHDNADHHRIEALLLEGRRGAAVSEHIRTDQQGKLEDFYRMPGGRTAQDLLDLLDWDKSGWPARAMFEPVFAAALRASLAIVPGDGPRETMRAIGGRGEAAIPVEERSALKLDVPLEPPLLDALLDELEASHCGLLPKSAFGTMALAQRYRDAHLARALAAAAAQHGAAVLLAGNGHVRADRGVPWYLRQTAANKTAVTVTLLEVDDGKTDPDAYVPRDPRGTPATDYVVFTPRAERPDPCAGMRERFKGKG